MKKDFKRQKNLKLSQSASITTVKMNTLPSFFKKKNNSNGTNLNPRRKKKRKSDKEQLTNLLGKEKKPQSKIKYLTKFKLRSGLALSNFKLFYCASCLSQIAEWITSMTGIFTDFWKNKNQSQERRIFKANDRILNICTKQKLPISICA